MIASVKICRPIAAKQPSHGLFCFVSMNGWRPGQDAKTAVVLKKMNGRLVRTCRRRGVAVKDGRKRERVDWMETRRNPDSRPLEKYICKAWQAPRRSAAAQYAVVCTFKKAGVRRA
jgi:hypothetical protein